MPVAAAQAIMGANTLINANTEANALEAQGEYNKQANLRNAATLSGRAEDAINRGETAAIRKHGDTQRLMASQKVAVAANGGNVNGAVAGNISANTEAVGLADENAIKTNAWREAYGLTNQAIDAVQAGENASLASQNAARNTMAKGTLDAAGYGLKAFQGVGKSSKPKQEVIKGNQAGEDINKFKGYA